MKKLGILLIIFASFSTFAQTDSLEYYYSLANEKYKSEDFEGAISLYNKIINQGYESPEVFYNLGNAYFKVNQVAKAILYYEKALKLSPNDEDIKFNLEFANLYTKDQFNKVPEFFADRMYHRLIFALSSDTWAIIALLSFISAIVLFGIFLFSKIIKYRKIGFFSSIFLLLIAGITLIFAIQNKNYFTNPNEAIIMQINTIKSSPEDNGTDLFLLNPGTKVKIENENDDWYEVRLPNGEKGWIKKDVLEKI